MKDKRARGIKGTVCLTLFFVFTLIPLLVSQAKAVETRGIRVIALDKASGQKKEVKLYHKSYAVIIGIDHYKKLRYDQQLTYAVRDAKGVEEVLRKNFKFDKIITLYNEKATKANIMKVLSGELSRLSKDDSVFVFWAGHGYTEKTDFGDLGYLLPFDGNFQESELYKNISMAMIKDDISKRIPAKHIFFVMDACYSGLLADTRGASRKSARDFSYLQEITKEQVRQVLTAGSKDQQVLDGGPKGHSVFAGRFIEVLEDTEDFITATEVSMLVKEKVFSDAKARGHTQTPISGALFGTGDYVFVPSLGQKVEDIQAKIADLKKKLERLRADAKIVILPGDSMPYGNEVVVYDATTHLEWLAGPDRDTTWDEARSWVNDINNRSVFGGGWRMPTVKELRILCKEGEGCRNMPPQLKTTGWWVWSSEPDPDKDSLEWYLGFIFGAGCNASIQRSHSHSGRGFAVRSRKR